MAKPRTWLDTPTHRGEDEPNKGTPGQKEYETVTTQRGRGLQRDGEVPARSSSVLGTETRPDCGEQLWEVKLPEPGGVSGRVDLASAKPSALFQRRLTEHLGASVGSRKDRRDPFLSYAQE